jgi:uncharacterized lipoprotein YajG
MRNVYNILTWIPEVKRQERLAVLNTVVNVRFLLNRDLRQLNSAGFCVEQVKYRGL